MSKKYLVPVALSALALVSGAAHAELTDAQFTAMMSGAVTRLDGVTTQVLAAGGVILGLAVIAAGIKWVKGVFFS